MISMPILVLLALTGLLAGPPAAFVLDPAPWDNGALYEYLERVARDGAAVWQADAGFAAGAFFVAGASAAQRDLARGMGLSGRMLPLPGVAQHAVTDFRAPASVRGDGAVLVLEHRQNASFTAISFLLDRRETVNWDRDGAVIVDSQYSGGNTARAQNFAEQYGLLVMATDTPPAPAFELHRPRVAVLRTRQDARWVEWVLDAYKVPFTAIENTSVARRRFDSLVLCGAAADAAELEAFVREGGTLVAIGAGAEFAVRGLGLLGVTVQRGHGGLARFDATHPVAFGMPAEAEVFAEASLVFASQAAAHPIATVDGQLALLEYALGRGRVLLFGFEPQFHGQAYQTFRLLLNAVYWASAQPLR